MEDDLNQTIKDLKEKNKILADAVKRHSGNVIEVVAFISKCDRHISHLRACAYHNDIGCQCRALAAQFFPEYKI